MIQDNERKLVHYTCIGYRHMCIGTVAQNDIHRSGSQPIMSLRTFLMHYQEYPNISIMYSWYHMYIITTTQHMAYFAVQILEG